jgi:predicted nucleotidyltransferase
VTYQRENGILSVKGVIENEMTATEMIKARRDEILAVAHRHGAYHVRIFGSTARGEVAADSDIDILVAMEPGRSLLDVIDLGDELQELLGRKVDVLTEGGLSPYLRDRINAEAVAL